MNTIALVNAQFGAYKNYFDLFLASCKANPTVDFFFITDQEINNPPDNIKVIRTTFDEFKGRIQGLFDFPISLDYPYDLCDYKVVFGELLSNELASYDFWGFCDTDIIFGQIRQFLTDEILSRYDKILIRGHFTLIRNEKRFTSVYRSALPDGRLRYREVFSDSGVHHFDEGMPDLLEGINCLWKNKFGWDRVFDEYLFLDLDTSSWRFVNADFANNDVELRIAEQSLLMYDRGHLFRLFFGEEGIQEQEFMYVHFQKRNMCVREGVRGTDTFLIRPNEFFPTTEITPDLLRRSNRQRIYWDVYARRLKRKMNRIFEGMR